MNIRFNISGKKIGKLLRELFLSGILVVVPVAASILILIWVFSYIDNILQPIVSLVWGEPVPGVGFVFTIILILLAGVIAKNVVGRSLVRYGESLIIKVPVFRQLYTGIKQVLETFSTSDRTGFMRVVLVEFPREGMRAIGLVTNESMDPNGKKMLNILIPTAPNPTSGFLQLVREEDTIRTKISVDEAIKMIVSAGTVVPVSLKNNVQLGIPPENKGPSTTEDDPQKVTRS